MGFHGRIKTKIENISILGGGSQSFRADPQGCPAHTLPWRKYTDVWPYTVSKYSMGFQVMVLLDASGEQEIDTLDYRDLFNTQGLLRNKGKDPKSSRDDIISLNGRVVETKKDKPKSE